jgi:hypothetical protein
VTVLRYGVLLYGFVRATAARRGIACGAGLLGDLGFGWFGGFWWDDVGRSFEELAVVEDGSGANQGDQVWGVDGTPAGLRGIEELVGHGNSGSG